MPLRFFRCSLALVLMSLAGSPVVWAQKSCEIDASAVRFGDGGISGASGATTTGRLRVHCPEGTSYEIAISRGLGGSYQPRRLLGPRGRQIEYNLFTSPAHGEVWGDGSAGTATVQGLGDQTFTLFGHVPAGQRLLAGEYEDSLVLTLIF